MNVREHGGGFSLDATRADRRRWPKRLGGVAPMDNAQAARACAGRYRSARAAQHQARLFTLVERFLDPVLATLIFRRLGLFFVQAQDFFDKFEPDEAGDHQADDPPP